MLKNLDVLIVRCPKCTEDVKFCTKPVDRNDLKKYNVSDIPPRLALDLHEAESVCSNCQCVVSLHVQVLTLVTVLSQRFKKGE